MADPFKTAETWFVKHHYCADCDARWDDEWDCLCDDECPVCHKDIEPESWEQVTGGAEEAKVMSLMGWMRENMPITVAGFSYLWREWRRYRALRHVCRAVELMPTHSAADVQVMLRLSTVLGAMGKEAEPKWSDQREALEKRQ